MDHPRADPREGRAPWCRTMRLPRIPAEQQVLALRGRSRAATRVPRETGQSREWAGNLPTAMTAGPTGVTRRATELRKREAQALARRSSVKISRAVSTWANGRSIYRV